MLQEETHCTGGVATDPVHSADTCQAVSITEQLSSYYNQLETIHFKVSHKITHNILFTLV
jgi:hypothetical protein